MKNLGWMFAGFVALCLASPWLHAASVSFSVDKSEAEEGLTVQVTFNLADAPPFAISAQLVQFDKDKLELTAQTNGSFATFVPDSRSLSEINTSGEVRAGGFGLDNNAGGKGTLGVFSFKTLKAGTARIWTTNHSPDSRFGTILKNKAGDNILPSITGDLTVTIVAKKNDGDPGNGGGGGGDPGSGGGGGAGGDPGTGGGGGGTDTDGDGIPNLNDPDDDNDGIPDATDPDDDKDGIPDATDPDDDNDGVPDTQDPDYLNAQANDQALQVTSAMTKLRFDKENADMIRVSGYLPVPDGFVLEGQVVHVDFGGVLREFTLDKRGRDKDEASQFRLEAKAKNKAVFAQDALFRVTLTKGTFRTALADEGLVNKDAQGEEMSVIMGVVFNGTYYVTPSANPLKLIYEAKLGKSATARSGN